MITSNQFGETADSVIDAVLDDEPASLAVVNPSADALEAFVDAAFDRETLPTIRLLAEEDVAKHVFDDFLVASRAADLTESDALTIRVAESLDQATALVTPDNVIALVEAGRRVGGLVTDDDDFVESVTADFDRSWDDAEAYTLRTPGISRIEETLEAELGADVEADFETVLASMSTARGDDQDLDEVTVSLLVAARNRELLYDISRWGEDVGLASKATFSRTKSRLEDLGIIETEKVPIDVGRPRLRLTLADERLRDASPEELASVATSVLAS